MCSLEIQPCESVPTFVKAVGTVLGLGGQKNLREFFFISHLHIKRIQFCSLVYL